MYFLKFLSSTAPNQGLAPINKLEFGGTGGQYYGNNKTLLHNS